MANVVLFVPGRRIKVDIVCTLILKYALNGLKLGAKHCFITAIKLIEVPQNVSEIGFKSVINSFPQRPTMPFLSTYNDDLRSARISCQTTTSNIKKRIRCYVRTDPTERPLKSEYNNLASRSDDDRGIEHQKHYHNNPK